MTDQPKRSRWKRRAVAVAVFMVSSTLYYVAYRCAAERAISQRGELRGNRVMIVESTLPLYRGVGGRPDPALATFFWLAHRFDRLMRPDFWKERPPYICQSNRSG